MAVLDVARGKGITVSLKDEGTFGTSPGGNWKSTVIYADRLTETQRFVDDDLLGLARNNDIDPTAPAPSLRRVEGDIEVPIDLNHIGWWLAVGFGVPTTSGTTNYTHVFPSAPLTPPSFSLESARGTRFQQTKGIVLRSIRIPLQRGDNFRRATLGFVAREQLRATASIAGTPAAQLARDAVSGAIGRIQVAGTDAGYIIDGELLYERDVGEDRYIQDSDKISEFFVNRQSVTIRGRLRFVNSTESNYWGDWGQDSTITKTVTVLFEKGANNSLTLAFGTVRNERAAVQAPGAGALEVPFSFRAEQTSSAAMMVATLKNQVSSYTL